MRFAKYLLIPWFSLALYTVLSVYSGATGFTSYHKLLDEHRQIIDNLHQLELINMELRGTMDSLLYDPEAIRIRARELGYGEPDELFIRIVGIPGSRTNELRPGMVRSAVFPHLGFRNELAVHRVIAVCSALLLLSAFLLMDVVIKKKEPQN